MSKETAAVLPALLGAHLVLVEGQRPIDAVRRTGPFWVLTLAWLAIHPTPHARLLSGVKMTAELEDRPPLFGILAKTMLSTLNLDVLPRPQEVGWGLVLRIVTSAAILGAGVVLAMGGRTIAEPQKSGGETSVAPLRFAAAWMAIGWFPLLLPSIGWHAYYGCLGTLGAWLAIAHWLRDRRRFAVVAIMRGRPSAGSLPQDLLGQPPPCAGRHERPLRARIEV